MHIQGFVSNAAPALICVASVRCLFQQQLSFEWQRLAGNGGDDLKHFLACSYVIVMTILGVC
jgi:hypothetical protein